MLIKECKIDANMFNHKQEKITPAFYHTYEYDHTTVSGYIKAHPSVVQLYQKHVSNCGDISLPASKLPMLVPPRPWTSITDGGHLLFSGNALNCPAQIRVEQLKVEQLSCLNTSTFEISFSGSSNTKHCSLLYRYYPHFTTTFEISFSSSSDTNHGSLL